jgi:hypothetical protein
MRGVFSDRNRASAGQSLWARAAHQWLIPSEPSRIENACIVASTGCVLRHAPPAHKAIELSAPENRVAAAGEQTNWQPFTGTSPKSLSGQIDRAHTSGRVPRLARCTRGWRGNAREHRGNLLHLVAADSDQSRVRAVFDPSGGWSLLRHLQTGSQPDVFQMSPTERLKSFRGIRRGDRQGLDQWLQRRSLQAFGSSAACWHEEECCHKMDYCPRTML